ncbi:DUF968 domain-containing protein, partial [Aeromonas hydrophila subsp. hydrophila]|uniref:DUF968 domain-containing protein n=1 Tax=Aeromonas hydrophila TaxID=644 RepID=UPI0023EFC169
LLEQDPLAELRSRIKAKPAVKAIDPEPPMLHIPRPKMKRWESANYLAFVRQLPCVVTGQTDGIEAHMELHNNGWQQWEQAHGSQLDHVAMTLNKAAGLGVFG